MKRWALIVAAGRGSRTGFKVNKVFMSLEGTTVLEKSIMAFKNELIDGITVVISKEDEERFVGLGLDKLVNGYSFGGKNRQESVFNGLKSIPDDTDIVAVHDAARPYVIYEVIKETIVGAEKAGSGVISTPVTDTIKQMTESGMVITPPRSSLFAVQTPQTFDYRKLIDAYKAAAEEGYVATDDAALFERYYGTVNLVTAKGAENNKKLTYRSDFQMNNIDIRVGHGFDAHRLAEERKLVLCGVDVPHTLGLAGHSDADVAVHALMDAMLGAAALGDIGRHFPDSDMRYKGISSMLLLAEVRKKLDEAGYSVTNADITIIAQRPKLAPYIEQMRINIAEALGLELNRINVKATTTEKMGYEGTGEGISSHAVVTIMGN